MSFYKTATASLTNGSAAVTGAGTAWVDAGVLNAGDIFLAPGGVLYEILSIQSNTGLTLASNYLGTTVSGSPYAIIPIGLLPSSLALQVKTTLNAAQAAIGSAVLSTAAQGLTTTQQNNARTNILALGAADVGKGLLVKSVAGGVDVVMTAAEASNQFLELTGALTASINLVVPAAARLFVIRNSTTGAYTVTVKTAAGTGVTALQGGRMLIECDGTNCVDAMSFMRQTGGSIENTPISGSSGSFTTLVSNSPAAGPVLGSVSGELVLNATTDDTASRNFAVGQLTAYGEYEIRIGASFGSSALAGAKLASFSATGFVSSGTITPKKAATASAPAYSNGAIYFDTTLNKLRIGGASAWETVTSA